jgi:hypothetical protein
MPSNKVIAEMLENSVISQNDVAILETPISELSPEAKSYAFSIFHKICDYVAELNKNFVPSYNGKVYITSDYINGSPDGVVRSMGDGKIYDSKSKYYKHLKSEGLVIADEPPKPQKPKEVDWTSALSEAKQRLGV